MYEFQAGSWRNRRTSWSEVDGVKYELCTNLDVLDPCKSATASARLISGSRRTASPCSCRDGEEKP